MYLISILISLFLLNDVYAQEVPIGHGEWVRSSSDVLGSRFSYLDQINKSNINDLEFAWEFRSSKGWGDTVQVSPVYTGTILATATVDGKIIAVDPKNGSKIWAKEFPQPVARRGLLYHNDYLYVPTSNGVHKVSIASGVVEFVFGTRMSLVAPIIVDNYLYIANYVGGVEKYSLATNERVWHQGLSKDCGVARIWSGFSYDPVKLQFYVTTGNSAALDATDSKNCFSNAVIAISENSGKIRWVFQEFEHDQWDLDMVSNPIVVKNSLKKNDETVIVALSKSGSVFMIDSITGQVKNQHIRKKNNGYHSYIVNDSMKVGSLRFGLKDLRSFAGANDLYVKNKLINFEEFSYQNPTTIKPVYLMGLHGGFEWPGGSLDMTRKILVATSNSYPWVIRSETKHRDIDRAVSLINGSPTLKAKCVMCHSDDLMGKRTVETNKLGGDSYVPAILNLIKLNSSSMKDLESFQRKHEFSIHEMNPYLGKKYVEQLFYEDQRFLPRFLRYIDKNLTFNQLHWFFLHVYTLICSEKLLDRASLEFVYKSIDYADIKSAYSEIKKINENLDFAGWYKNNFWQMLTDINGFPVTKPPWGKISAFDLTKQKKIWEVDFGFEYDAISQVKYAGARNFGGVLTTKSGLVFATGAVDGYARSYDINLGKEVWSKKLPYVGSSPPVTYLYGGCQYVVFTATGGRFSYFQSESGHALVAYKLSGCVPK